jgi:hypothetical protein
VARGAREQSMSGQQPAGLGAFSDDEAALKKGKGGMLIGFAAAVIALLVGAWVLLSGEDEARAYGDLGRKINGMRQASFDQFWACVLPTANLKDITTNTQLVSQIDGRAMERGRAYGLHLREQCVEKLSTIEPELEILIVPEAMRADVDALKEATSKLRGSVSAFISYLDNTELRYEQEAAAGYLEHVARAWFDWKQAHSKINKLLKEKLSDT